jgi:tetratricopeptide (TPR) repeat protein
LAATAFALDHDPEAARQALEPLGPTDDTSFLEANAISDFMGLPNYWLGKERGDWRAALDDARAADAWLETYNAKLSVAGLMQSVWIHPLEALAMVKAGDAAGALSLIETTPADCYLCLRVRGQIAAQMHDWPAAERWFGEAARQAPSLPFAFAEWGEERLARGDADGALFELQLAHETAPLFADALELMGEALMRKGDYRHAVDKFRSADEAAPRWGRNHLRWGESLLRLGREREAKAQLETARRLNLDGSVRAELDAVLARTAAARRTASGVGP